MRELKKRALAKHLNISKKELTDQHILKHLVCTNAEAETAWEDDLYSYLYESVLPNIPKQYRKYFNNEAWIKDAKRDGRGHVLAAYDGKENETTINKTTFYIYRTY